MSAYSDFVAAAGKAYRFGKERPFNVFAQYAYLASANPAYLDSPQGRKQILACYLIEGDFDTMYMSRHQSFTVFFKTALPRKPKFDSFNIEFKGSELQGKLAYKALKAAIALHSGGMKKDKSDFLNTLNKEEQLIDQAVKEERFYGVDTVFSENPRENDWYRRILTNLSVENPNRYGRKYRETGGFLLFDREERRIIAEAAKNEYLEFAKSDMLSQVGGDKFGRLLKSIGKSITQLGKLPTPIKALVDKKPRLTVYHFDPLDFYKHILRMYHVFYEKEAKLMLEQAQNDIKSLQQENADLKQRVELLESRMSQMMDRSEAESQLGNYSREVGQLKELVTILRKQNELMHESQSHADDTSMKDVLALLQELKSGR